MWCNTGQIAWLKTLKVNSLLAAKNFGVQPEQIVVGNGAAELIKVLMDSLKGKVGVIRPTFEEYPNRKDKSSLEVYDTSKNGFHYTVDDLIYYFGNKDISTLILINPDNPSGNYISKFDVLQLAKWAANKKILLIVDESFVDFADEDDASLITEEVLTTFNNLVVIKSISKSFGVPGLRLGVLASGNESIINLMKKSVAIWNINSFGEFYLQIYEKYRKDYESAMQEFRKLRGKYVDMLKKIKGLDVLPSQANYVMCKVSSGISSRELAKILLDRYDILIKDLSTKTGINDNYIRLAVRNENDNTKLVNAIKEILKNI